MIFVARHPAITIESVPGANRDWPVCERFVRLAVDDASFLEWR